MRPQALHTVPGPAGPRLRIGVSAALASHFLHRQLPPAGSPASPAPPGRPCSRFSASAGSGELQCWPIASAWAAAGPPNCPPAQVALRFFACNNRVMTQLPHRLKTMPVMQW